MKIDSELSIIVPVLNEAATICGLLRNLACQRNIRFEVIICDGGSSDGTIEKVEEEMSGAGFPIRVIRSGKGRGRQMNLGASAAVGDTLLFLHADSLFEDPMALRGGLDRLSRSIEDYGNLRVAGHFALRFARAGARSLSYYFNECKARLNRIECTHGDQGFMLPAAFFGEVGPFDEKLPVMEDTRLAERIRAGGKWVLLPAEILTSPRRFETEGLAERQILNAVLMALAAAGCDDFLLEMPRIYANHDISRRLRLHPFFREIDLRITAMPPKERQAFWSSVGKYVLENAWQPAFMLDVLMNFRKGLPAGTGTFHLLERFDRWNGLHKSNVLRIAVAIAVRALFRLACLYTRLLDK